MVSQAEVFAWLLLLCRRAGKLTGADAPLLGKEGGVGMGVNGLNTCSFGK